MKRKTTTKAPEATSAPAMRVSTFDWAQSTCSFELRGAAELVGEMLSSLGYKASMSTLFPDGKQKHCEYIIYCSCSQDYLEGLLAVIADTAKELIYKGAQP